MARASFLPKGDRIILQRRNRSFRCPTGHNDAFLCTTTQKGLLLVRIAYVSQVKCTGDVSLKNIYTSYYTNQMNYGKKTKGTLKDSRVECVASLCVSMLGTELELATQPMSRIYTCGRDPLVAAT